MSTRTKNDAVIAVCIQELTEEGSAMDLGVKPDELKFLYQAFITDTVTHALDVPHADTRLYYIADPERKRLIKIISDYLGGKLGGKRAEAFKNNFMAIEQPRERFGIRMEHIFNECFEAGYKSVLLVGSRTPTLTAKMLKTAVKMLKESDAVFGPTPEGRYYVIGMAGGYRIPLATFDWKSPNIYLEISEAFAAQGLSWSELEIWYAVESAEYLEVMARDINQWRFEGDETTAKETELVIERILTRL